MSILENIISHKKEEIKKIEIKSDNAKPAQKRSLNQKLSEKYQLHLIAEVKKASPSKGTIYQNFNPLQLAQSFERNGASCISVLTDENFFKGNKAYLMEIKENTTLPILRKDFIIDPIQVEETKQINADIMLLILDILSVNQANELIEIAYQLNIEVLLEIHSEETLKKLTEIKRKPIVGINNRDLNTFNCNIDHAIKLSKEIRSLDKSIHIIAESGYSKISELQNLEKNNINGVLIGEGLRRDKKLLDYFNHET